MRLECSLSYARCEGCFCRERRNRRSAHRTREHLLMPRQRTSTCSKCGSTKIIMSNRASRCVPCHNRSARERYEQSEVRRANLRRSHLRRRYGASLEDLERILDEQGGCCAICRQPWRACVPAKRARYESTFFQHLCIDHDHRNGNVRGLLCNACNAAIGFFEEDVARLASAARYLRRHDAAVSSRTSISRESDTLVTPTPREFAPDRTDVTTWPNCSIPNPTAGRREAPWSSSRWARFGLAEGGETGEHCSRPRRPNAQDPVSHRHRRFDRQGHHALRRAPPPRRRPVTGRPEAARRPDASPLKQGCRRSPLGQTLDGTQQCPLSHASAVNGRGVFSCRSKRAHECREADQATQTSPSSKAPRSRSFATRTGSSRRAASCGRWARTAPRCCG